jgi:hypothetical protein
VTIQPPIINEGLRNEEEPMCPACMANAALMAGSVFSTGGIAALAMKVVRWKKSGSKKVTERRNDDVYIENGNDVEQDGTGNGGTAS